MRRALIIGIDEYEHGDFPLLSGCVNDARAIHRLLETHEDGSKNFTCLLRVKPEDTSRSLLTRDIERLLEPGADVALLYFAGHGRAIETYRDAAIVTTDGDSSAPGIYLSHILSAVADSHVREVLILLDCCQSGTAAVLPLIAPEDRPFKSGVAIFAACQPGESAMEADGDRGVFTSCVCEALEGGAADVLGQVTAAGLYSYVSERFGLWARQRPIFKAHLGSLWPLRLCHPAVNRERLLRITSDAYFPTATHHLALDESYEPETEPSHPEHEAVFADLQRFRDARLVVPVGAEHLYYAALRRQAVKLTPLGQQYWHMVNNGSV